MSRWAPKPGGIPVKLVFDGIQSGSPEARALYNLLQGPINQFYQKASQTHTNSGLPSQYLQQRLSGGAGHIRYSNIYGQETLHVKAAPEVIKKVQEQIQETKEPKKPWDWAFFELVIPLTDANYVGIKAKRIVPSPQEVGITNDGNVFDNYIIPKNVDGLTPPVLSYPNHPGDGYEFELTNDGNKLTSTLYVDLRRFNGGPVVVEIYGVLDGGATPEEVQIGYYGPEMEYDGGEVGQWVDTEFEYNEGSGALTLFGPPPQQYFAYSESGTWRDGSVNPFQGFFVLYQDAPLPPLPMIPGQPQQVAGQTSTGFLIDFGTMMTRHEELVYDPASGIVTSITGYSADWFVGGDTIQLEPVYIWRGTVGVRVSWTRWVRTIQPGMGTVYTPIPVSANAEAWIAGGDGELKLRNTLVKNSKTQWVEHRLVVDGSPQKVRTGRIRDDVRIWGPAPSGEIYNFIGTLVIDPMTRSAAFNLP